MKIASLLAGVAAVTLMAAPAMAEGPIYKGAATGTFQVTPAFNIGPFQVPAVNLTGTVQTGQSYAGGLLSGTAAVLAADAANPSVNSDIALFTIASTGFAANQGTLENSAGATFAMTGNVSTDCAFYTGGTNTDIAFGTIGINAQGNNPGAAFEMIGGNRTVSIDTNLAGCNTRNTVTISKTDLTNTSNTGGFDALQFTNRIPVSLNATFTAAGLGEQANGTTRTVSLTGTGIQSGGGTYGAWKSAMDIDLTLTNPGLGLLAGDYAGSVSVLINSQL